MKTCRSCRPVCGFFLCTYKGQLFHIWPYTFPSPPSPSPPWLCEPWWSVLSLVFCVICVLLSACHVLVGLLESFLSHGVPLISQSQVFSRFPPPDPLQTRPTITSQSNPHSSRSASRDVKREHVVRGFIIELRVKKRSVLANILCDCHQMDVCISVIIYEIQYIMYSMIFIFHVFEMYFFALSKVLNCNRKEYCFNSPSRNLYKLLCYTHVGKWSLKSCLNLNVILEWIRLALCLQPPAKKSSGSFPHPCFCQVEQAKEINFMHFHLF